MIARLIERGDRILIAATTNRAVDGAALAGLESLAGLGTSPRDLAGRFVRLSHFVGGNEIGSELRNLELAATVGQDAEPQEVARALRGAQVIATSLSRLAVRPIFREAGMRFDTVIIDEASIASLPHIAIAAGLSRGGLVIAGDPAQLAPISISSGPAVERWLKRDVFLYAAGAETTEELFAWQSGMSGVVFLNVQYRMPPSLSGLISGHFYQGRIEDGDGLSDDGSIVGLVDMAGSDATAERNEWGSHLNAGNAAMDIKLAEAMSERFSPDEIGIITPYRGQAQLLRRLLRRRRLGEVEAATIHTFQGREKSVIIFDLTDGPGLPPGALINERKPGYLPPARRKDETHRLINVAFSRAKQCLLVVADGAYMRDGMAGQKLERLVSEMPRIEPGALAAGRLF